MREKTPTAKVQDARKRELFIASAAALSGCNNKLADALFFFFFCSKCLVGLLEIGGKQCIVLLWAVKSHFRQVWCHNTAAAAAAGLIFEFMVVAPWLYCFTRFLNIFLSNLCCCSNKSSEFNWIVTKILNRFKFRKLKISFWKFKKNMRFCVVFIKRCQIKVYNIKMNILKFRKIIKVFLSCSLVDNLIVVAKISVIKLYKIM